MRDIYLVCHGQPQYPAQEPIWSHTDLPLSPQGITQLQAVSQWLDSRELEMVYTSPLHHCAQSAALLAGTAPVQVLRELTEIYMGRWEGLTLEHVRDTYPLAFAQMQQDIGAFAPPGGETFIQCQRRAMRALGKILSQTTGNVAVVGHPGLNRAILCELNRIRLSELRGIEQPYGCINILQEDKGRLTVLETALIP